MIMKLYLTRVASFKNYDTTDLTHRYEIDIDSCKKVPCIECNGMFYDISSNEKYYLLKRNERGFIETSEQAKIKLGVKYALEVEELAMDKEDLTSLAKALRTVAIAQNELMEVNKKSKLRNNLFQKQLKR